jgi:hypothetical protein
LRETKGHSIRLKQATGKETNIQIGALCPQVNRMQHILRFCSHLLIKGAKRGHFRERDRNPIIRQLDKQDCAISGSGRFRSKGEGAVTRPPTTLGTRLAEFELRVNPDRRLRMYLHIPFEPTREAGPDSKFHRRDARQRIKLISVPGCYCLKVSHVNRR